MFPVFRFPLRLNVPPSVALCHFTECVVDALIPLARFAFDVEEENRRLRQHVMTVRGPSADNPRSDKGYRRDRTDEARLLRHTAYRNGSQEKTGKHPRPLAPSLLLRIDFSEQVGR